MQVGEQTWTPSFPEPSSGGAQFPASTLDPWAGTPFVVASSSLAEGEEAGWPAAELLNLLTESFLFRCQSTLNVGDQAAFYLVCRVSCLFFCHFLISFSISWIFFFFFFF